MKRIKAETVQISDILYTIGRIEDGLGLDCTKVDFVDELFIKGYLSSEAVIEIMQDQLDIIVKEVCELQEASFEQACELQETSVENPFE